MEVNVRCQLTCRNTITSLAYNKQFDILSSTAQGTDTASFYTQHGDLQLIQVINQGNTKPPALTYLSWNNAGNYLALAKVKVQVWRFQNLKFSPLQVFNEGFLQISGISWAPDNSTYLCYGLVPHQSQIKLCIRNIESKQIRHLILNQIIIAANFDPFGKYIAVLTKRNHLELYDVQTLKKFKTLDMTYTKNDKPTLKQHRIIDWSPQFGLLATPNLNDSKISSAIIFDRNKKFNIKQILVGHQTPISCLKFSPQIYEYNGEICLLLASGDTSGCLALWRISTNKNSAQNYNQPLCIFSSPHAAEESIENIIWSRDGTKIYVNVMKKYILCIEIKFHFDKNQRIKINRCLDKQQKNQLILSMYGATQNNQISGKILEVFGQTNQINSLLGIQQANNTTNQIIENKPINSSATKQPLIRTKQQIITKPGQKKRIKPSIWVPQSSIIKSQPNNQFTATVSAPNLVQGNSFAYKPNLPLFKLPIISQKLRKNYLITTDIVLQTWTVNSIRFLQVSFMNQNRQVQYQKVQNFKSEITHLQVITNYILVIHSRRLYIFDWFLQIKHLPIYIGDISAFSAHPNGFIYFIMTNGMLKGIDFIRKRNMIETSIGYLFLEKQLLNTENQQNSKRMIEKYPFQVFEINEDGNIIIQLKQSTDRYYFNRLTNSWTEIKFQEGLLSEGHSLKVSKIQKIECQNFYRKNLQPKQFQNLLKQQNADIFQHLQLQILYYRENMETGIQFQKNNIKYKQTILRYIIELKNQKKQQVLRNYLRKLFYHKKILNRIEDIKQIWEKTKKIGGKAIQQFVILQPLSDLCV